MAKNKKGKTPKKGASASEKVVKKQLKGAGSKKSKKILKQKLRHGFVGLSPSQVSTPKGTKTPKKLAAKLVAVTPKLITAPSTATAPSSFGSAENSPMTRQAVSRNPNVREMFKNVHMVPNMGLKRKRTDRMKTGSLKVNCIKSEINNKKNVKNVCADEEDNAVEKVNDDKKNTVEKVFAGPVPLTPRTIIHKNEDVFINPTCSSSTKTDNDNQKDIDEQKDIDNHDHTTILLDDSTDNLDASQKDVIEEEPIQNNVWQQDSSKILFPETPPPPKWKGPLNTPAPPQINDTVDAPEAPQIGAPVDIPAPPGPLKPPASHGPLNNRPSPVDSPEPPRWNQHLSPPNEAIVIEDDKKSNNPIEDLGEEILEFVNEESFSQLEGVNVPATPKTLLQKMDLFKDDIKYSSDESENNEDDEIIVIDDNDLEVIEDEDSDLEIIEEVSGNKSSDNKPMTTSNIQEVLDRYQPPTQDFIGFEIDTRPGEQTVSHTRPGEQTRSHPRPGEQTVSHTRPGEQTVSRRGQRGQNLRLKNKWKEMRKNKLGRKNFGKDHNNINTQPLPNLICGLAGPSNFHSNQRVTFDPSKYKYINPSTPGCPSNLQINQKVTFDPSNLQINPSNNPKNNLMVGPNLLPPDQRVSPGDFPKKTNDGKKLKKRLKAGGPCGQGEWKCACGNYNFGWRKFCNDCKTARSVSKVPRPNSPQVPRPKSPQVPSSTLPKIVNVGPTMFVPEGGETVKSGLRPIVMDGSNVAMLHGRHANFSAKGIEICIQYFKKRGHSTIIAFLPEYQKGNGFELFGKLEKEGHAIFTPSRYVQGKRIASYDDRFIIEYAHGHGGVIVSRDNYRDILEEKPEWRETIEERLLMPTFVGDTVMFPSDPLGKPTPTLDEFLKF